MSEMKVEVSEKLDRAAFIPLLRQVLECVEGNRGGTIEFGDQKVAMPTEFKKFKVEYEVKEDESELCFKMKWESEEEEED